MEFRRDGELSFGPIDEGAGSRDGHIVSRFLFLGNNPPFRDLWWTAVRNPINDITNILVVHDPKMGSLIAGYYAKLGELRVFESMH